MPEIITHGTIQNTQYHASCSNCGCHFKFKKNEVNMDMSVKAIICPQCRVRVLLTGELKIYQPYTQWDR